jgi:tRNA/tmRNA/rRNA uracil-C5-methylase (TrmA/RlmC/RlmD family)
VSYETQLALKRETVRKAFRYFSSRSHFFYALVLTSAADASGSTCSELDASLIPEIGETIPSPKQAGYRTKMCDPLRGAPSGRPR